MSEGQIVSLVAVVGALVLVVLGFRSRRVGTRKSLSMAMIWIGIFVVVGLVFGSMQ